MNTRRKTVIAVSVSVVALLVSVGIVSPNTLWASIPCQPEFGIPEANALIAHQTIGEIYNQSDVIVVGTITESYPCQGNGIVTRMTVEVEEYVKNPQSADAIVLESRGGEIPGVGGMWVEDEKIFGVGDDVLLFLYEPEDGIYKINPYSTLITDEKISGMDLIEGVELRAENNRITLDKGETGNIALVMDSFFGYDKATPISVAGFTIYDLETEKDTLYENSEDLEKFGIHINSVMILPKADGPTSFELPIVVDENATDGKYFIEILAKTPEPTESIKFASWKTSHKQIQVVIGNEK